MSKSYFQKLKRSVVTALSAKETLAALLFLIGLIIFEALVLEVSFRQYFGSLGGEPARVCNLATDRQGG